MKKLIAIVMLAMTLFLMSCRSSDVCVRCGGYATDTCIICGSPVCMDCYDNNIDIILECHVDYDYVAEWAKANGYKLVKR